MADEPSATDAKNDAPDAQLGDAGKKALDQERAARKAAEKQQKAAEAKAQELETRLSQLEEQGKSEQEKAIEAARKEERKEGYDESSSKFSRLILKAEAQAAAAGKLVKPELAPRLLDLDEFEVKEDGTVDTDAMSKAIDSLIKDTPELAANGKRPAGGADQGARNNAPTNVEPGLPRLKQAYAAQESSS